MKPRANGPLGKDLRDLHQRGEIEECNQVIAEFLYAVSIVTHAAIAIGCIKQYIWRICFACEPAAKLCVLAAVSNTFLVSISAAFLCGRCSCFSYAIF